MALEFHFHLHHVHDIISLTCDNARTDKNGAFGGHVFQDALFSDANLCYNSISDDIKS